MSKKSVIMRNKKRERMAVSLDSAVRNKRISLIVERKKIRSIIRSTNFDGDLSVYMKKAMILQKKIHSLKRDSSIVRYRRRCAIDGRPRGFYRDFGISRIRIREMAGSGLLPGINKW